jgi:S-DNA-T family DNA segregation ATPase FtsK/SpoIIIE
MGARRRAIEVDTFESESDDPGLDTDDEVFPVEPPPRAVRRARQLVASAPPIEEPVAPPRARNEPKPKPATPPAPVPEVQYARGRELGALLFVAAAVFLSLGLASYDERGGADWVGPVGARLAQIWVSAIGVVAWAVPVELALFAIPYLRSKPTVITPARIAGDVVLGATGAALVHVGAAGRPVFGGHPAGGAIGELFGEVLRSLFSTVGTFLVGTTVIALVLIARAAWSFIEFANRAGATTAFAASKASASVKGVAEAWNQAKEIERAGGVKPMILEGEAPEVASDSRISIAPPSDDQSGVRPRAELRLREDGRVPKEAHEIARQLAGATPPAPSSEPKLAAVPSIGVLPSIVLAGDSPKTTAKPDVEPAILLESLATEESSKPKRSRKKESAGGPTIAPPSPEAAVQRTETTEESDEVASFVLNDAPKRASRSKKAPEPVEEVVEETPPAEEESGPEVILTAPSPSPSDVKPKVAPKPAQPKKTYKLPAPDLLENPPADVAAIDREALLRDAKALMETLATYKVVGEVKEIHPGPVVTTFELEPRIGTKVREVEGLANDLRLSLAKESVRIVAPIPGKNRIGFELPNAQRIPVNFRELVEDRRFLDAKGALPVILGRDIVGAPVYEDLAAMPHLLVAGATGAGKSVGLNVMLTSLLYRRTPEDLRMIMIDPKVVELAPFDRIPHMLLPVVTDMKQALNALKWCVDEMERRYQLLAAAGVKNITTYNAWREKVVAGLAPNPCPKTVTAWDHNNLPEEIVDKDGSLGGEQQYPEKLPYLVVVVDEFADLMMSVGKGEVEPAIARLAQKARAAGIHVILATQRPSVDVITGMIKANFPTRIAFRVAQRVDSRTILDAQGAEYLLGKGDMLASINGKQGLKRIQCPFVSEEEVQAVTDFLRAQGEPVFDESILAPRDDEGGGEEEEEALSPKDQELFDRAVELVREARKCSTSWLQRKMGLGYNKAARFVDRMERNGIVGPSVGAGKDREVF